MKTDIGKLEMRLQDVLRMASQNELWFRDPRIRLVTQHPIAVESNDHKHPRGTKNDDTRFPRLVTKAEAVFPHQCPLRFLDLGCSGGGLVLDFLLRGHYAVGLEGSDYSLRNQRAEWRVIPQNLLTCDIAKPFILLDVDTDRPVQFDLITAWEVLEHLPETEIPQFFENVAKHLATDGYFLASVATFEDKDPTTGAVWHVTVKEKPWWEEQFKAAGFEERRQVFDYEEFPRGTGRPNSAWDVRKNPELGFHVVLGCRESA
ncbi:MAG: class I SAM-dependent methyltransferase [Thermoguttaceae bacterium]